MPATNLVSTIGVGVKANGNVCHGSKKHPLAAKISEILKSYGSKMKIPAANN